MKALRVSVGSNMVSWLQQFLGLGGLEVLLNILNTLEVKQKYVLLLASLFFINIFYFPRKSIKDLYVIYECVQCIKAVMNNDAGINF